jgi:hypothetical protein
MTETQIIDIIQTGHSGGPDGVLKALKAKGLITIDPEPPPKSEEEEIAEQMIQAVGCFVEFHRVDQSTDYYVLTSLDNHLNAKSIADEVRKIIADWLIHLKAKWMTDGAELERDAILETLGNRFGDSASTVQHLKTCHEIFDAVTARKTK